MFSHFPNSLGVLTRSLTRSARAVFIFALFPFALLPFALVLASSYSIAATFVAKGSDWRYLDDGSNQGSAWRSISFNDASWQVGGAQLGYGDGDERTELGYGPSSSAKFVTSYFRQSFQLSSLSGITGLSLQLLRDDGAVVYINGSEVLRSNMPSGSVSSTTRASGAISGGAEDEFIRHSVSASTLVVGENVIAVEIHQSSGGSSDISFDLSLESETGSSDTHISRGPYLQMGNDTHMTVRWRTDIASNSRVLVGSSPESLTLPFSSNLLTNEHEILLSNLTPDTRYYYSVGTSDGAISGGDSATYFETSPSPGTSTPTRVWVVGDAGTANSNQRNVYEAYQSLTGDTYTDLFLMLGDNAYNDGTDSEYQAAVFDMYGDILRTTPLWSTLGNHDGRSADSADESGVYYDIFSFPRQAEVGGLASGTEAYYSFDYANIHFVVLDSQDSDRSVDGSMLRWMESDLQQTSADWIIAFWHHPPYTKGSHDSDSESQLIQMRENALPILERYGVDLVLSGHSHSYERTKLIGGHYGKAHTFSDSTHAVDSGSGHADGSGAYVKEVQNSDKDGAVYITAGSSGKATGGDLDHEAMFISLNTLGALVLEVDGLSLNLRFVDDNSNTQDYFTINKSGVVEPDKARITGQAWRDSDRNGIRAEGESTLSGVAVSLKNSSGLIIDTASTSSSGAYSFDGLNAGNYRIEFQPASYDISPIDQGDNDGVDSDAQVTSGETFIITAGEGEHVTNIDIGLYQDIPAVAIPGVLLMSSYDAGGEGLSFHDTTAGNEGDGCGLGVGDVDTEQGSLGCNVGWIDSGEWMDYSINVDQAGLYTLQLRLASQSTEIRYHLELDGADISGVQTFAATGGWQNWETQTLNNIVLSAGAHRLRFIAEVGGFNVYDINMGFGGPIDEDILLGPVSVSGSTELQSATLAIDGDMQTRWESNINIDPSWLTVDLGRSFELGKMDIMWEAANPEVYEVQGSNDNSQWDTLAFETGGSFGHRTDALALSGNYRYVRIYGTERSVGNLWGYSIWELQIYGH
jgi:hypothetical protein